MHISCRIAPVHPWHLNTGFQKIQRTHFKIMLENDKLKTVGCWLISSVTLITYDVLKKNVFNILYKVVLISTVNRHNTIIVIDDNKLPLCLSTATSMINWCCSMQLYISPLCHNAIISEDYNDVVHPTALENSLLVPGLKGISGLGWLIFCLEWWKWNQGQVGANHVNIELSSKVSALGVFYTFCFCSFYFIIK